MLLNFQTIWNPCVLTILLQLSKAVITDTCWLVLQVLQVVLIGRACLTHHLSDTHVTAMRKGFIKCCVVRVGAVRVLQTFPQARQWCLLQVRVNSQVQIMHMVALRSGIQMGAFEPNGAPLSTTHSAWVQRDWALTWTRSGWNYSQKLSTDTHTDLQFYLLLTSTRYECYFLLSVVVYGLGDGLQPLVSLCSWAATIK